MFLFSTYAKLFFELMLIPNVNSLRFVLVAVTCNQYDNLKTLLINKY
jgi:hypothetical protein